MLKTTGRRVDLSRPFVDAMLPQGHRLHVVLQGISRSFSAVNIRKFVVRASRLTELVDLQSLTPSAALFLEASVRAGLNILVSGGTQAGKTTMLNCLAAAIPGGERVISVEEVFEIRFPHPDWVALQTRQEGLEGTGEIRLRDLIKESLRMRPSRIIVGEVRAEEASTCCWRSTADCPGSARPRQQRTGGADQGMHPAAPRGREHLGSVRGADGRLVRRSRCPPRDRPPRARRVTEIVAVPGRIEHDVIESEPSSSAATASSGGASGMPPRAEQYERVGIDVRRLLHEAE